MTGHRDPARHGAIKAFAFAKGAVHYRKPGSHEQIFQVVFLVIGIEPPQGVAGLAFTQFEGDVKDSARL